MIDANSGYIASVQELNISLRCRCLPLKSLAGCKLISGWFLASPEKASRTSLLLFCVGLLSIHNLYNQCLALKVEAIRRETCVFFNGMYRISWPSPSASNLWTDNWFCHGLAISWQITQGSCKQLLTWRPLPKDAWQFQILVRWRPKIVSVQSKAWGKLKPSIWHPWYI